MRTYRPDTISALRAIDARIHGRWDDPDLMAFGPLSDMGDDISDIVLAALEAANVDTSKIAMPSAAHEVSP